MCRCRATAVPAVQIGRRLAAASLQHVRCFKCTCSSEHIIDACNHTEYKHMSSEALWCAGSCRSTDAAAASLAVLRNTSA